MARLAKGARHWLCGAFFVYRAAAQHIIVGSKARQKRCPVVDLCRPHGLSLRAARCEIENQSSRWDFPLGQIAAPFLGRRQDFGVGPRGGGKVLAAGRPFLSGGRQPHLYFR